MQKQKKKDQDQDDAFLFLKIVNDAVKQVFYNKRSTESKLKNQIYILEKENQDLKNQLQFALSNNNLLESARKDLAQEKLSLMEEIQDLKHANSDLRRACDDEGMLEVKETLERRTKRLDNVWKDVECLHILMDKKNVVDVGKCSILNGLEEKVRNLVKQSTHQDTIIKNLEDAKLVLEVSGKQMKEESERLKVVIKQDKDFFDKQFSQQKLEYENKIKELDRNIDVFSCSLKSSELKVSNQAMAIGKMKLKIKSSERKDWRHLRKIKNLELELQNLKNSHPTNNPQDKVDAAQESTTSGISKTQQRKREKQDRKEEKEKKRIQELKKEFGIDEDWSAPEDKWSLSSSDSDSW